MDTNTEAVDVVVIGGGISGVVTLKCLLDAGLSAVVIERTDDVGGLWKFRENDYGVMSFTHINVSKYNYCFSDFPFPDDVPDYPHNKDMAKYVGNYVEHFDLRKHIRFHKKVLNVKKENNTWTTKIKQVEADGKTVQDSAEEEVINSKFVAIATGHHAKPSYAKFPGQDSFKEKRVLLVGIGNSAVDVAVNCATVGRCKSVYVSTRSGAWVVPNYIFGHATDLYACRLFFKLPWKLANTIFEALNPKMQALSTQPTVSPTLIHHIQRGNIKVVPNVQRIEGSKVVFMDDTSAEFDNIILCTGYKIDLPYLEDGVRDVVLDDEHNDIKLYKNVFSPEIGSSLAFIGFVQPASGGVLTMSEIQARWFAEMCKGQVQLPSKSEMEANIAEEKIVCSSKYYKSARHTIQRDPIVYNDEIADLIGAKPSPMTNPGLAWRLLLSSCGASQWRLQGPNSWSGAADAVKKVPLTDLMNYSGILVVSVIGLVLAYFLSRVFGIY
ncbi:FMO5-like protein [Mya arenaria]|uniref:Flavin-containing monooxygenase n=1 Tax=Mya arenaria TaxID=6604 RepID=A0ABY7G5V3_MYAAR|nr:FMO5-like protein [Mya arenaria]